VECIGDGGLVLPARHTKENLAQEIFKASDKGYVD
jgi:hypothetical protein